VIKSNAAFLERLRLL